MFKHIFTGLCIGASALLYSSITLSTDSGNLASEHVNLIPEEQIHTVQGSSSFNATILGGTVMPIKMVNLIAQMPGEVKYIAGEEGDSFEMGTTLVSLDEAALMEKRRAAVAAYNSARAGLANAQVQYRREILSPNTQANSMLGGAPSMFSMFSDPFRSFSGEGDPAYERYSNVYGQSVLIQTARDQLEMALAGIYELDENIKNLSSVAPFQGVIVKKMVEVGDVVQPGMPIVVFADTSRMYIQVEVPARLVSNLSLDTIFSASLDRGGPPVPVKIDRIFPMANQGGHTTTVKFELPAGTGARAGMYAEVAIPASLNKTEPLAVIPESAISWRGSLPAVFAISDDNMSLKMRTLRLGKPSGKDMVSVITGISIGDRILKEPLASTRSGPYKAPAL